MKLQNPEICFETTNFCNARCIMCPREKMTREEGILDMGLYKRVIDEGIDGGLRYVCLVNFGECFLDPHIFERARYARSKELEVYTVTNASLLDEDRCRQILECFDRIRISLFGTTKDTYEKIHRGLSFEVVQENVARLFNMRQQAKDSKLKIEMYFLLMDENRYQMKDFLNKYENMADEVSVWKPHNWGDGRRYREISGQKMNCGRPFRGPVQIQWDGVVVPCCFDYDSKMPLGDLNKQSLEEVLSGREYNLLRDAHKNGNFSKFPFCDLCDQLNKREDVLVYSTIKDIKVGTVCNSGIKLNGA